MKPVTLIGVALIIVGVLALAYQGITYTTREKVIDLGPLKASVDKQKTIPLPPILGALALAGGVVLVIVGARKSVRLAVAVGGRLSRRTSDRDTWQHTAMILPPRRRTAPSCSVRRYLAWSFGLISVISSRKIVPASASSK